jgi:SAM-dependent methyltransferase
MPDAAFADPRLAQLYDPLDPDRSDLDVYANMVGEFDAQSVLDVGCGTGTLACFLADRGVEVTAVDPAEAMLAVARSKPGASGVRWVLGDPTRLPTDLSVDAAFMTGNVAQVFLTDEEWEATLRACRRALRPAGHLVFEVRDPSRRAWEGWTRAATERHQVVPGVGEVRDWVEVQEVRGEMVTFRWTVRFEDGSVVTSDSTLRFRTRAAIESSLATTGFVLDEIRDAPDRPGLEWVFVAHRPRAPVTSATPDGPAS